MDHKEVVDRNIIELYLRQELSSDDETAFEEHLLLCETCRNNLNVLELSIKGLESIQTNVFRGNQAVGKKRNFFIGLQSSHLIKAAASVAILAGIAMIFILVFRKGPEKLPELAIVKYENDSASSVNLNDTLMTEDTGKFPVSAAQKNHSGVLAENFRPSPFYENLAGINMRNSGMVVISPVSDTVIRIPVFEWDDDVIDSLTLVIISNSEKLLYKKRIRNGSIPGFKVDPGLYYWQLQNEHETLFTGRFIYLPHDSSQ